MDFLNDFFFSDHIYFDAFDRLKEAFYVCDTKGNLIYINKVAEELDGYVFSEIKGKSTYELYGLDETRSPMLKALFSERPVYNQKFTYYVNGREIVQLCNAAPFYVEGKLAGAYTLQRDETPLKEIIEKNISLQWEVAHNKSQASRGLNNFDHIIGESDGLQRCKQAASRAAKNDSSVMLVGDTGSGKELFARAIHDCSSRGNGPFLALNCAAIPESLLEGILFGTSKGVYTGAVEREGLLSQADGGTIFLDEVNSMPLTSQAKLLRVLEDRNVQKLGSAKGKRINTRMISSCNVAPSNAVANGQLREDLFYRLSVVHVVIPPLKQRRDDIPLLARYFLERYNKRFEKKVRGIDREVMDFFMKYDWPGNVRQLKSCIESAVNFTDDGENICLDVLPQYLFEINDTPQMKYKQRRIADTDSSITSPPVASPKKEPFCERNGGILQTIKEQEKNEISAALLETKGNLTKAAALLGMSRQTLTYRVKKYNL